MKAAFVILVVLGLITLSLAKTVSIAMLDRSHFLLKRCNTCNPYLYIIDQWFKCGQELYSWRDWTMLSSVYGCFTKVHSKKIELFIHYNHIVEKCAILSHKKYFVKSTLYWFLKKNVVFTKFLSKKCERYVHTVFQD